ncbi:hypothetical protein MHYP_G00322950 [Metynnis hypsauchen]
MFTCSICYFTDKPYDNDIRYILDEFDTKEKMNKRNQLSSRTHMTSCCSLAEIRIQQFNFIDIIYELVLLGDLRGARPPVFPRPRGFLSHLMAMLCSISMVTEHRMPMAEEYMFHVKNEMFLLLDDIFSLKEILEAILTSQH